MKIIVLSDNRTINSELETEHGLCVYLETEKYKCLLDTGASDIFISNAARLNVDLADVDYVFISHGHADHTGGLPAFLALNKKAKIVMSENAIKPDFYSERNGLHLISIKLDDELLKDRLILVGTEAFFEDDIHVFCANEPKFPFPKGNRTLFKDTGEGMVQDDFNHEIIVSFGTEQLFLFTGCTHKGVLNVLNALDLKPGQMVRYVMGGFHLLDPKVGVQYETAVELMELGKILHKHYPSTDFITGHCTGEKAFEALKRYMEYRLIHFFTGYKLEM